MDGSIDEYPNEEFIQTMTTFEYSYVTLMSSTLLIGTDFSVLNVLPVHLLRYKISYLNVYGSYEVLIEKNCEKECRRQRLLDFTRLLLCLLPLILFFEYLLRCCSRDYHTSVDNLASYQTRWTR